MKLKSKKRLISVVASAICLLSVNLNALTLKESVLEVLDTNPVVQERLKNFNETQQDLANDVKYLVIGGDLVDGIGINPNQEKELKIKDKNL